MAWAAGQVGHERRSPAFWVRTSTSWQRSHARSTGLVQSFKSLGTSVSQVRYADWPWLNTLPVGDTRAPHQPVSVMLAVLLLMDKESVAFQIWGQLILPFHLQLLLRVMKP